MLFNKLIIEYSKEWKLYTEHKFGKLIANGKLNDVAYKKYMIQDLAYLNVYAKCWKSLAVLTNNISRKKYALKNSLEIIEEEITLRKDLDVKKIEDIKLNLETKNYINFMNKMASTKDYYKLFFALFGCFVGYFYLGQYILSKQTSSKYQEWINVYTNSKYYDEIQKIIEQVNLMEGELDQNQIKQISKIFQKTLILEKKFFDQVF